MGKVYVAKMDDAFEYKEWGGCIEILLMPPLENQVKMLESQKS